MIPMFTFIKDDRRMQYVGLELKTTAIVVARSNIRMYNHTWNTMLVAEEATSLCILLGRYSVACSETHHGQLNITLRHGG
jgi:hypothetical protein